MTFFTIMVGEVLLGTVIGFMLSDNKRGLSFEEFKISNIIFLLSTIIIFWRNPEIDVMIFVQIAIAWFLLMLGVFIGELLKTRLISRILRSIRKKDIQLEVNDLVNIAIRGKLHPEEPIGKVLYAKLDAIQVLLSGLIHKEKSNEKIVRLYELCEDYVSLSVKIQKDIIDGNSNSNLLTAWTRVGNELTSISWDTLNHTEESVKKQLNKAFPSISLIKHSL